MKTLLTALLLATGVVSAAAQGASEPNFESTCNESRWGNQKGFCETRDLNFAAPAAGQTLTIDGRDNGGITVRAWSGSDVRVRARVQSWAKTTEEAQSRVKGVKISSSGNSLRATAPGDETNWSVSYEVFVPQHTALALNTVNGGISVEGVQSNIKFDATNGGITLKNVGGKVSGHTTNGGLHIALSGSKWEGEGLDVTTTNGGITWDLPRNYSAKLFTSTTIGGIHGDLPVTKTGMLSKEIAANLGQGGAPVRAVTTNGGIKVNQAGE
ncbi:DUF4097 family beta strand repeat-containing protein [Hymenobacter sp. BT491]|uniref:DUF4097 family beta strand repeat-containing protein n=1 Tax=Hymenobacter sp. BT491 TaxID=2766779 RepID=UPI0016537682|nr:DUF4097 family beta strand repeat-containing protein [Hymenobacter sp. BT491]MBC6988844.1 DUF4097 family beta strand repeat protein [Hymenobacter sp. BT491]